MQLYVSNEQEGLQVTPQFETLFSRLLEAVLQREGVAEDVEVSLLLVNDERIQELNRDYRGMDQPTDVLSFALRDGGGEPEYESGEEDLLLGDIVISIETAQRQALEYGHSLERELGFLFVHGCLHLLGYDHGTEEEGRIMGEKEETILTSLGLNR